MEKRRSAARGEWVLLGLTGLFLCVLLGLFYHDRTAAAPVTVERTAVSEELQPQLEKININTAGEEKLAELPGIGEALARRIVEYREAQGPFGTIEELTEVSGIGQGKLSALEGLITVEETE